MNLLVSWNKGKNFILAFYYLLQNILYVVTHLIKKRGVYCLLLTIPSVVLAQKAPSPIDTVHLNEVVTVVDLKKYQSGSKIEKISSSQFHLSQDGNLEDLLSRTMPIPFKANAGGFSTIRVRGTSPNHTSINFGGININSLTLGHSNVSNVPTYLFDEVGVQFGSSAAMAGSGSIGGAIHLGIQNNWTDGVKAEFRTAQGSFGEQLYGTKLFFGNGKFESATRSYYYFKTNDFTFKNPNYRDFKNNIFEIKDNQHNANINKMGLLQELNYRFSSLEMFKLKVWLEKDNQQSQQNMQTNLNNPNFKETYNEQHVRVWTDYSNKKNAIKYQISGGYVFDDAIFSGNSHDTIQTQRVIGEACMEHDIFTNSSYKIGAKATRIKPNVYAYSSNIKFEDQVDLYAFYYHRFLDRITATINIRQEFVSNFTIPITPSFGMNYLAISREKYILNITGNIAKSYRVPSFNDRFWVPGGNPNLKPEKGLNYELGSKLSFCETNFSTNFKVNAFFMNINDWILWKNGGAFWYAENVENVESKGIETMIDAKYKIWVLETSSGINYSFTSAQRVKSLNNSSAIHRQMEYVPLHSGNIYTTSKYKNFDFTMDGNYASKQYTDEEKKNILKACFLLNFASGYRLKINNDNNIKITGMVNNIMNINYQSSWGYAMPGINYRITVIYNFN